MKLCLQSLLTISLQVSIVLGVSAQSTTTGRALYVTANATYPDIGSGDTVVRYSDLMLGPEPEERFANIPAAATALNTDPTVGSHGLIIRMSEAKQHVGELKGQRIWDVINDALTKMCPLERGRIGCYEKMPGAANPKADNSPKDGQAFYKKYWVKDVPYRDIDGNYAHNAWLTLTMRGMFRNQQYPGIGAATYEMIAGVYKKATEYFENCYVEDFNKKSRPYEMCNVPKHVMVALPVHNGQTIHSWVSLTLKFNGKTKYGDFKCYNTMIPVIDFWEQSVLPDVAKSMGTSVDVWKKACIQCLKEDDAFDVHKWRNFEQCSYLNYPPN